MGGASEALGQKTLSHLVLCLLDVARMHIYLESWIHSEAIISVVKTALRQPVNTKLISHCQVGSGKRSGFPPWKPHSPQLMELFSWFLKQRHCNSHEELRTRPWTWQLPLRVMMHTYGDALAEYKLHNGAHYALVDKKKWRGRMVGSVHDHMLFVPLFFFTEWN